MANITIKKPQTKAFQQITIELTIESEDELIGFKQLSARLIESSAEINPGWVKQAKLGRSSRSYYADDIIQKLADTIANL